MDSRCKGMEAGETSEVSATFPVRVVLWVKVDKLSSLEDSGTSVGWKGSSWKGSSGPPSMLQAKEESLPPGGYPKL